jgi:uncharacterized protein (DUF849 family)
MPELEIFDSGDLNLAKELIADGTVDGPGLYTFVMGVKYGLNTDPSHLTLYARSTSQRSALGRLWDQSC